MSIYLTEKKISVVIPCYNEADNIPVMYERLTETFKKITPQYEFIFVDNASTDQSELIYHELCKKDPHVSIIIMSRNFGSSDTSYTAGTEYALGDAVVWIDGDIQDPPELIVQFVEKWREGYEVIYGIRAKRKAGMFLRLAYRAFYSLFKRYSYVEIPQHAGDFSLLDRKVVDILNRLPERDRFLRGLRAWVGFRHTGIEYERAERVRGKAKTNLGLYMRIAKKGLVSFSYAPLTLVSNVALFAMIVSLIALVLYPAMAIFYPAPRGFLTLLVAMLFMGSIQFCILAIIGEYVGRIFEEVKGRPKYIIRTILNDHRTTKS